MLPLHALQRAEVLCLQLPAPPPLPGLMFLECQRGGLVGAPQPVLVAPSLGVSDRGHSRTYRSQIIKGVEKMRSVTC